MFNPFRRSPQISGKQAEGPLVATMAKASISLKERRRLADTDGARRRMLQTVEDNRLR